MGRPSAYFSRKSTGPGKILLLVTLSLVMLTQQGPGATVSSRVVAVGDIHGDLDALVTILHETGLMDDQQRWAGQNAILVQTGDFLDRGAKDRQIMDLLMALEQQAAKEGGQVVVLLGNHEVMNLMGDLRYVAPETYLSFADEESEKRRQEAYQDYLKLLKRRDQALEKQRVVGPEFERQWMQAHPPGFLEHRKALGPKGKYGRWLRKRPAIVQIADTIFLHGGIHPNLTSLTVKEINQRIKNEIEAFDTYQQYMVKERLILSFFVLNEITTAAQEELERQEEEMAGKAPRNESEQITVLKDFLSFGSWLITHPNGPLWFRGFARWSEQEGPQQLSQLLEAYSAQHFVVGHTPQLPGQIQVRFGGRIFLIDTGMLSSYYAGGQASALEIQGGKFTAIYPGQREELHPPGSQEPGAGSQKFEPSRNSEFAVTIGGAKWQDVSESPNSVPVR